MIREIRRSKLTSRTEVTDLIQAVFVSEMLRPSASLWLVSPWISDIPVIDNRALAFSGLDPDWSAREIRLTEVLAHLARRGTELIIITLLEKSESAAFLASLHSRMFEDGTLDRLHVGHDQDLHEKGIVGDGFHLAGSMNITYSGVRINTERITYSLDRESAARARADLRDAYATSVQPTL